MFLEALIFRVVQTIRTNPLGPTQDNLSVKPALIFPLKKKIPRERGLLKVYPDQPSYSML